jgi:hypothetical protein
MIEGFGLFIFGGDHEGGNGNLGTQGTECGICQEGRTETTPLKSGINGETTEQSDGDRRITGKPFGKLGRQFIQRCASGRKRVVTCQGIVAVVYGNIAGSRTAADILARLFLQVTVKGKDSTAKGRAIMFTGKRLYAKPCCHSLPKSSR